MVKDSNIRAAVWAKYTDYPDKMVNQCFCCHNNVITAFNFHMSHIIASNHGGPDCVANLRPCCASCNTVSGTQNLLQYRREKFGLQVCLYPDCYHEAICGRLCLQHEDEDELVSQLTSVSLTSNVSTSNVLTSNVSRPDVNTTNIASLRKRKLRDGVSNNVSVIVDDYNTTHYIMNYGETPTTTTTTIITTPVTPITVSTPTSSRSRSKNNVVNNYDSNKISIEEVKGKEVKGKEVKTKKVKTKNVNFGDMTTNKFFFPKPSSRLKWDFETYDKFQDHITYKISPRCNNYTSILEILMRYYLLEREYFVVPHSTDRDYMVFCNNINDDDYDNGTITSELCIVYNNIEYSNKDYIHYLCSRYQLVDIKDSYKFARDISDRKLTKSHFSYLLNIFVKDCDVYDSNSTFVVYNVQYAQTDDDNDDYDDDSDDSDYVDDE